MQRLATQVEIAVLQADFFRVVRLAEHRQGQFGRLRQDFNGLHTDFDLACGQVGIDGVCTTGDNFAIHPDDALGAQALDDGEAGGVRGQDQLGQAIVVAQVDENETAVVALAMDPAREADGLTGVGGPKGAAGMTAIGVHVDR